MIPIANQPILFYGLQQLARAGIREVGIVLGPIQEGIREGIGEGANFGLRVTYIEQGPPRGLAHAVLCAGEFLGNDPFVMYLGDNLLEHGLDSFLDLYRSRGADAVLGVASVADPHRYGIVELDGSSIRSIEEKPRNPKSNLALVGVYVFSPKIHEIIARLKPSLRGELEITDAIVDLRAAGAVVVAHQIFGWWKDTGAPDDLLEANDLVLNSLPPTHFSREGSVVDGASLQGLVAVGRNSVIEPGATVEGPVVLGSGVRLTRGTRVGPGTSIGNQVELRGCSVRRSIVLEGARILGPVRIIDSLIGRNVIIQSLGSSEREISVMVGDASRIRL
jgi:glucose-1-phosphate thymidylyltransferase